MDKLEKCRCGNKKPKLEFRLLIDPPRKIRKQSWQVKCLTCDISGPKRESKADAVISWNDLITVPKPMKILDAD